jgi:hypothetical protein
MSDLLRDARDLRQKLQCLEVLLEIERGRKGRGWFGGKAVVDPERSAAIKRLSKTGLVESAPAPIHFRLTSEGREFLKDVRAKVSKGGELDWTHADEIDFSKL